MSITHSCLSIPSPNIDILAPRAYNACGIKCAAFSEGLTDFDAIGSSFAAGRETAQPAARQGGFFRLRTIQ